MSKGEYCDCSEWIGNSSYQGVYVKPQFLTKIEDKSGVVIYEPIPESLDVLNKDIAFAIIKLLEGWHKKRTRDQER